MTTGAALLTLEDAYDEAIWDWPAEAFDEVLGSEEEFDDAGVDEHARARVENASPHGLVARLQDTPTIAAPSSLSDTLDLLRAADRLASWAAAQRARLVAQVHTFSDREHRTWSGSTSSLVFTGTVVETAALLKLSEGSAARLVSESLSLTGDLTDTLAALEKGEICAARASVIVEQTRTVPHDAVRAFEAEILQVAGDLNRPRLTARCRRLREKLHPETLTARRVKAAADRCVVFEPDQDGMAWLNAYLPAEQALALHTTVDAAARNLRADDDPRTLPQLRADAARKLAADATSWMRLLTHPYTGAVLGLDRTRYRPSEDLRTWVQLREKTCSFYGCSRSASRCDLDHLLSWADDGSTGPDNLYPVCRRHHMLKHQTDWTPTPGPDGGLTWLSPGGRTYTTPPEPPPGEAATSATARVLHDLDASMGTEQVSRSESVPPF